MKGSILIVEDHQDIAQNLKIQLERNDYQVCLASDGEEGLQKALTEDFSLVILDISLPKKSGLEVLEEIRKENTQLPIMMLTSKVEELDKVVGLTLGADDYVTKPFTVAELFARIEALLRRAHVTGPQTPPSEKSSSTLSFGELSIDLESRNVTIGGKSVSLTTKEFDMLELLARNPGRAFSHDELIEAVWGYSVGHYSNSVKNIVLQLRRKIEKDPANPVYVFTVRGYGYRFARENET